MAPGSSTLHTCCQTSLTSGCPVLRAEQPAGSSREGSNSDQVLRLSETEQSQARISCFVIIRNSITRLYQLNNSSWKSTVGNLTISNRQMERIKEIFGLGLQISLRSISGNTILLLEKDNESWNQDCFIFN